MRAVLTARMSGRGSGWWAGVPRRCPVPTPRSTSCSPPRPGIGSTSRGRCPRWHGYCGPSGGCRSSGAVPIAPSAGCGTSGRAESSSHPTRRLRPTNVARVAHAVNVDGGDDSPFFPHEAMLFRWQRSMSKEDLVALATTYRAVITIDNATAPGSSRRYGALPRQSPGPGRPGRCPSADALLLLEGSSPLKAEVRAGAHPPDDPGLRPGHRDPLPCPQRPTSASTPSHRGCGRSPGGPRPPWSLHRSGSWWSGSARPCLE